MLFSKKKYKQVKTGALFMMFILLGLMIVSCENEISKINTVAKDEDPPAITAEGFEMLISDSSVIRSKLQTPLFIKHNNEKNPYIEFPKGVNIEKYDAHMNVVSRITAQYAKNFPADDRWEAKNNVVAVNAKGDTLKTEYLVWDVAKKKIYSDQFVKIIQKDQVYTGIGFESNPDFSSYHIKNLKGNLYVNVDK